MKLPCCQRVYLSKDPFGPELAWVQKQQEGLSRGPSGPFPVLMNTVWCEPTTVQPLCSVPPGPRASLKTMEEPFLGAHKVLLGQNNNKTTMEPFQEEPWGEETLRGHCQAAKGMFWERPECLSSLSKSAEFPNPASAPHAGCCHSISQVLPVWIL